MTKQTQMRIPTELKNQFRSFCLANNTSMTTEVVRFMRDYINRQLKDGNVINTLKELDTTRRTGLVRDARGTWTSREQLQRNNEWSNW